jgi:hypothetical protein
LDCKEAGKTAQYQGETGKTAFERGAQHDQDLLSKKEDSPLWKHCSIHHQERVVKFDMVVTGVHKSAMERLNNEIVRIKTDDSDVIMNSKNDWAQPALVRVVAVTGNQLETQVGDTQPSRQERRAAREAGTPGRQAGTPGRQNARRRRRQPVEETESPARRQAQPGDRAARLERRRGLID